MQHRAEKKGCSREKKRAEDANDEGRGGKLLQETDGWNYGEQMGEPKDMVELP